MVSRIGHTTSRHPLCPSCGYDLVATIDAGKRICPECGEAFELHDVIRAARPGDWTLARGIGRLLLRLAWRGAIALVVWTAIL
jgi:predicted RNA-binding Zn-ribbon protein involved in translation (DUF1610 family)